MGANCHGISDKHAMGGPNGEFRDVGTRRRIDGSRRCTQLPRFSPHNGGENLRPAIIHYKADMSPITEKVVRIFAVRLLGSAL